MKNGELFQTFNIDLLCMPPYSSPTNILQVKLYYFFLSAHYGKKQVVLHEEMLWCLSAI